MKAKKSLGLKTGSFVRAKKALGQNFLKSVPALNKIIEAGEISPSDIILEIGPGKGALTTKLLEKAGCVIAVEKDKGLFDFLKEKFSKEISENPPSHKATGGRGKLILINEDILNINIKNVFEGTLGRSGDDGQRKSLVKDFRGESENIFNITYKVIANIPYNITGAILKKFLTEKNQPSLMVLMVQKEVAKRIVASDKKESILSISVKAYGTPKMILKVPARYFSPAPKVDSAVIAIKDISRKLFNSPEPPSSFGRSPLARGEELENKFWELIHAGFAHKRKKLSSNLKNYTGEPCVKELGNKRAEDLSLENWVSLLKDK